MKNRDAEEESELEHFYREIGKNVKRLRRQKGMSQLVLANAIGHASVGHIAKAELYKYKKRFNLEQLFKIAKALGVTTAELIDIEPLKRFYDNENDDTDH